MFVRSSVSLGNVVCDCGGMLTGAAVSSLEPKRPKGSLVARNTPRFAENTAAFSVMPAALQADGQYDGSAASGPFSPGGIIRPDQAPAVARVRKQP